MNNLYMRVRRFRWYNTARADNYNSREAMEGVTLGTVKEKSRATGEVNNR